MHNWIKVDVSLELWQDFVTRGYECAMIQCREGLPEGAALAWSEYDKLTRTISLVYEHPSFREVPDRGVIPRIQVEFRQYYPNDELWNAVLEDVGYQPVLPLVEPALEDLQGIGT